MEEAILERLLRAHETRPAGTLSTAYQQRETGHIESLVAIYEVDALPLFETCLNNKKLKISRIISAEQQHLLTYSTEEALPFFNINYPADLKVARLMFRMLGK
jgi:molybdopterin-guanine dinucleotide biosynthesis protein A